MPLTTADIISVPPRFGSKIELEHVNGRFHCSGIPTVGWYWTVACGQDGIGQIRHWNGERWSWQMFKDSSWADIVEAFNKPSPWSFAMTLWRPYHG